MLRLMFIVIQLVALALFITFYFRFSKLHLSNGPQLANGRIPNYARHNPDELVRNSSIKE